MAITGQDVLAVAQSLGSGGAEAKQRMAIGRWYYGAFLVAREIAGNIAKGQNAHMAVQQHFRSSATPKVGTRLQSLHRLRKKADYQVNAKIDSKTVQQARKLAEEIRADLGL